MRCKLIARRAPDDARESCSSGEDPFSLGGEGANLPDISRSASEQSWVIDPLYYQYRGCTCLLVSWRGAESPWLHASVVWGLCCCLCGCDALTV
jgi:hypothetical protein